VLNVAYNLLAGGSRLEHIEARRNDEVYLDALGADRIPDPTTAGDFCRRFSEADVLTLMEVFNETRLRAWKEQPDAFLDEALIDADGTLAPTDGWCKQGVDMTYDFAGPWTNYAGHNAPLFSSAKVPGRNRPSTEATMRYLVEERGMPADRLAVGIPLYGRGFAVSEPYAPTEDAPEVRIPQGNYSNLHTLLNEEGWTRLWDDEIKAPWLLSPDHSIVFGYDDDESVTLKTEWAMKQGFRGVFFWQVAADRLPDGSHPLQEAAREAWQGEDLQGR
jgi:hypothetical protein